MYGGMLFDSNEEVAIRLCEEALNYCVDPGDGTKFRKKICGGYSFHVQGKKKHHELVGTRFEEEEEE